MTDLCRHGETQHLQDVGRWPKLTTPTAVLYLLMTLALLASCSRYTKRDYLAEFEALAIETKENYRFYSDIDWKAANRRYEQLAGPIFRKFKADLSPSEYLRVQRLRFTYSLYSGQISPQAILSGKYNRELGEAAQEAARIAREGITLMRDIRADFGGIVIDKWLLPQPEGQHPRKGNKNERRDQQD